MMKNKSIFYIILLLIILSGCGILGTEEESTIKFGVLKNQTLKNETVSFVVFDNLNKWNIEGILDTNSATGSYSWRSETYKTSTSGEIAINFNLQTDSNKIISSGTITIPLKKDWAWSIDVFHANSNPLVGCFGCVDSKAFPILNEEYINNAADSIYLVYGGNSISHPVIY